MAMASKPPYRVKEQTFYVSHHALDRMRERSKPAAHLDDGALARLVDDAVVGAMRDKSNISDVPDDQGEEAQLVYIEKDCWDQMLVISDALFALVKDNDRKDSKFKRSIVTVLSEEMGRKRYLANDPKKAINTALADQLKEANVKPAPKPQQEFVPPPPQEVKHLGYLVISSQLQEKMQEVSKETACELAQKDPWVRIYRYVPFRVKVELEG